MHARPTCDCADSLCRSRGQNLRRSTIRSDRRRASSAFSFIGALRRRVAAGVAIGFALFCLLILSSGANADETPLTLAGSASSNGGEITIPVPDSGGIYSLTFLRKAGQDLSSINLYASSFIGAQGDAIPIKIQLPGDAKDAPAETRKDIPVSGQLLLLALVIPPLPHSGSYQGTLIVTAPAKDAIVVKITLQRPAIARPATLVVDPKS